LIFYAKSQADWERRHREIDAQRAETDKQLAETDKQLTENAEQLAETRKQVEATSREVARLSKNVGGLGNSVGGLIETLIASRLWEKFKNSPYNLKRAYRRVTVYNDNDVEVTDIDILLSDTDITMAVEVKREPDKEDVDDHLKRMELIKRYPPAEARNKKLLGAIAGGFVPVEVRDYAHKCGFYVLELKGESVCLADCPAGFKPKEW
jgi:hypothetical protein